MREIIQISIKDVKPHRDDVLESQGIPPGKASSENVEKLLNRAMELFLEFSQPSGILSEISVPEFERVYQGEGLNEKETPLEEILTGTPV